MSARGRLAFGIALCTCAVALLTACGGAGGDSDWNAEELGAIRALWIGSLPALPPSPTNRVADDPEAALLGHRIFFDPRFSGNGSVSCATCHQPERFFTDGLTVSVGLAATERNAMSLVGAAYSPWLFWDGRKDSLWSQALAPLESAVEHGGNRTRFARIIAGDRDYRASYEALFGPLPPLSHLPANAGPVADPALMTTWEAMDEQDRAAIDTIYVNLGKALEAYQRRLLPGSSAFDAFAAALLEGRSTDGLLTADQVAGLELFIGPAQCTNCHNGPLLTNNEFHNTAVLSAPGQLPSRGRSAATAVVAADPTNCMSRFSDDDEHVCPELRFMRTGDELLGAHRTPSLRNVADTAPYMHAGQQPTLAEVLAQYNEAPEAMIGHNEAKPLGLSSLQLSRLEAFLGALSGPIAAEPRWLRPPPTATDH